MKTALCLLLALFGIFASAGTVEPMVCGVGIVLMKTERGVEVHEVVADSPAANAGVMPGTIIAKVDGKDLDELTLEKCVELIRGVAGTDVVLTLANPKSLKAVDVTLTRAHVSLRR